MKKKIIFILIALVVMITGIIIGVKIETGKSKSTVSEEITHNIIIENQETHNKIENTEIDTNTENLVGPDGETLLTDLEKAILIVKKDWGEDETVKFVEDGKTNNGEYIIAVRDKNSTKALAWYTVNTRTGVFVKE